MKCFHIANRLEVFEAEKAGKSVIMKVDKRSSVEEVEQLLKSAIHLSQFPSLLPGQPCKSPKAKESTRWSG